MRAAWLVLIGALWLPLAAIAQDAGVPLGPPPPPPVLVVNQDALFEQSAFGRSAQARLEAASAALVAENRKIEAALEAEERDLTERRATMPPEDFRAESEAFNVKVEGIRKAQNNKSRAIAQGRDEDRQRFLQAARLILAQLMREHGAMVVLDQSLVVQSVGSIDITAEAVRRLDAEIGTGNQSLAPTPLEAPAP